MSGTMHCNTIKSHNTVCAHTALLKAAELVLMEAGSTMRAFEIQTNFNKILYWMLFWPRVLAYVLQFPVPYLLSVKVLWSPTMYAPVDK